VPFAEVIGDPIAQSLSPLIHRHWLEMLALDGEYRTRQVEIDDLDGYLAHRRSNPAWRGCNVTIPHKERVLALLDHVDPAAAVIGAVNCVVPGEAGLTGYNSDIDGVAAALNGTPLAGRRAVLIGAGGASRSAVAYLAGRGIGQLAVIARDPGKAESLRALAGSAEFRNVAFDGAGEAFENAALIVNASPLGTAGGPEWPRDLLDALAIRASGATLFDMVYKPLDTPFLAAGRRCGTRSVDGLTMLIGQARRAFELFFRTAAPDADAVLRGLLVTASGHSSVDDHTHALNN
jgi:shikimate dehydrogenase